LLTEQNILVHFYIILSHTIIFSDDQYNYMEPLTAMFPSALLQNHGIADRCN